MAVSPVQLARQAYSKTLSDLLDQLFRQYPKDRHLIYEIVAAERAINERFLSSVIDLYIVVRDLPADPGTDLGKAIEAISWWFTEDELHDRIQARRPSSD